MSARGLRKSRVGVVIRNKTDKSCIVEVTRLVKHPFYKKYVRKRSRLMAHDANNECQVGDKVKIVEVRPLSRRKRWSVRERLV